MSIQDLIGLGISYTYATTLLAIAELCHRFLSISTDITRKIIHVGAGMWVLGILWLFDNWQIGIIPFASFIGINYLLYRDRLIKAMDSDESSPGTVYFAISVTLLFMLLWRPGSIHDQVAVAVAGTMTMTWGDAFAALIGKGFGKHQYQVWQSTRSWEGSLTMFVVSVTVIFLVLMLLPGSLLSPLTLPWSVIPALIIALIGGIFATLVEAISPRGTDNLTVPLVTSLVVSLAMKLVV